MFRAGWRPIRKQSLAREQHRASATLEAHWKRPARGPPPVNRLMVWSQFWPGAECHGADATEGLGCECSSPGERAMSRPIHFEIHADDVNRAIKFYETVFNWRINRWGETEPAYWLVMTGDEGTPGINGGLMARMGPPPGDGQPVNAFVNTIDVDNFDAYAKAVIKAGGRQVVDRMAVPRVGWLGYFKDTEGNIFGLMEADTEAA
jgi:hypothetical protein